ESGRRRTKPGDGRLNLAGKRGELVVDEDRPVLAVADPDVPAVAEQHGDSGPDLHRADLDVRHVLLRRERCAGDRRQDGGGYGWLTHGVPLLFARTLVRGGLA